MKLNFLTAIGVSGLMLASCNGPYSFMSNNADIGIAKSKPSVNKYCLFDERRVPSAPSEGTEEYKKRVEFQYMAFKLANDELIRFEARPGSDLAKKLQKANDNRDFSAWEDLLRNADNGDFVNIQFEASAAPPRPQRPTNRGTTTTHGENPGLTGSDANPLNIEMHYFTRLTFLSLDKKWKFDSSQIPFRVAVGDTGKVPPFSGPMTLDREGSMFTVDYYNGRDKKRPELPVHCVYDYELNMEFEGRSGTVTRITIDPRNGGDGAPDPE